MFRSIFRGCFAAGVFFLVLCVTGRAAARDPFSASDGKWRYYRSTNFELYSRDTDEASRTLLHNLELLRSVFVDTFHLVERQRLEVTIYLFTRASDFEGYLPASYSKDARFSAFYAANPDRALIVMGPSDDRTAAQQTIFHEYIHHLIRVGGENPPAWINEGMAELFSTIVVQPKTLEFGRPSPGRLYQMSLENMMRFEQLFAVDHRSSVFTAGSHTGLFYAESWALLHYWYFGKSGFTSDQIDGFMDFARAEPAPSPEQLRHRFQEMFKMDYPAMEKLLDNYTTGGTYGWRRMALPKLPAVESYATRAVPAEEARLRLAELALRVNRSAQARLVLLDAVQRNPSDPRPLEVLGSDALREDNATGARERWQQALDAGSVNPAIYRELGRIETRAWFPQFDVYFRLPAEKANWLRELLLKSIEYSPQQSEAYELLAWVEAFGPNPSIRNINLVQSRYASLKNKDLTLLAFANVRHRLEDNATALQMLDELAKHENSDSVHYGIESLRAKIEGRPMNMEGLERSPKKIPLRVPRPQLPGKP